MAQVDAGFVSLAIVSICKYRIIHTFGKTTARKMKLGLVVLTY